MLLSRDDFRNGCLERDKYKCVICGATNNLSVHHIIERKLFPDGGYYLENGATLCDIHHIQAEITVLSVEEIRSKAQIRNIILPPDLDKTFVYDKWGNRVLSDGSRQKGKFFNDSNVQKALKEGNVLERFVMTRDLIKYPRTPHILGSRFQNGDEDMDAIPIETLADAHLVIEEKVDGSQVGISFVGDKLHLQSRGHYLTGGPRERQYSLLKVWANTYAHNMLEVLGERYIMYGEWLYAKHTVFYDALPHYFMEFDIYDIEEKKFLSTPARQHMTDYMRLYMKLVSVPVLKEGNFDNVDQLKALIMPSLYKSENCIDNLKLSAESSGVSWEDAQKQTNLSNLSEGLYIKHEEGDQVVGRYKFVRGDFLCSILDSGSHWMDRPIVPNLLGHGVNIYE